MNKTFRPKIQYTNFIIIFFLGLFGFLIVLTLLNPTSKSTLGKYLVLLLWAILSAILTYILFFKKILITNDYLYLNTLEERHKKYYFDQILELKIIHSQRNRSIEVADGIVRVLNPVTIFKNENYFKSTILIHYKDGKEKQITIGDSKEWPFEKLKDIYKTIKEAHPKLQLSLIENQ